MGSQKVLNVAQRWAGKEFRPGVPEQCMGFVRHVLQEAGSPVANLITKAPVDKMATLFLYASSLAGRDIPGQIVDKIANLEPGSIVFFEDTYGDWDPGTITHVGIYVGDGQMVHRPTMARPVERVAIAGYWADHFRCGLNLKPDEAKPTPPAPKPVEPVRDKVFAHTGRAKAYRDETQLPEVAYQILVSGGKAVVMVNGETLPFSSLKLEIVH